ncbi:hypothetical protein IL306_006503 [Fusarium sp. DS 682]|nr:hypothetical protein IL306_006503 [Fusarium sp. DS 682]
MVNEQSLARPSGKAAEKAPATGTFETAASCGMQSVKSNEATQDAPQDPPSGVHPSIIEEEEELGTPELAGTGQARPSDLSPDQPQDVTDVLFPNLQERIARNEAQQLGEPSARARFASLPPPRMSQAFRQKIYPPAAAGPLAAHGDPFDDSMQPYETPPLQHAHMPPPPPPADNGS